MRGEGLGAKWQQRRTLGTDVIAASTLVWTPHQSHWTFASPGAVVVPEGSGLAARPGFPAIPAPSNAAATVRVCGLTTWRAGAATC